MIQFAQLRHAGLKATKPRVKILSLLGRSEQRHLSAEAIYRALSDAEEDIGLATIYRVLTQFEAVGLVSRHYFEGGLCCFELNQGLPHYHLICVDCRGVSECVSASIQDLVTHMAQKMHFKMKEYTLNVYGHCVQCQGSPRTMARSI